MLALKITNCITEENISFRNNSFLLLLPHFNSLFLWIHLLLSLLPTFSFLSLTLPPTSILSFLSLCLVCFHHLLSHVTFITLCPIFLHAETPTPDPKNPPSNVTLSPLQKEELARLRRKQLANAVHYLWETGEDKYMLRYFHTGFWLSCEKHNEGL